MQCVLCGHRSEGQVCEACTLAVARRIVASEAFVVQCWGADPPPIFEGAGAASFDAGFKRLMESPGPVATLDAQALLGVAISFREMGLVASAARMAAAAIVTTDVRGIRDRLEAFLFEGKTIERIRERLFPA